MTSGTIFASRKLAFVDLLGAIAVPVNGAKGVSALQLSRCTELSYKTAFVLAHKIQEALAVETEGLIFDGTAESTVAARLTEQRIAAASWPSDSVTVEL